MLAVDGNPNAVGLAEADLAEAVDFTSVEQVVEFGRRQTIDAVVAISTDRAVPVAAVVAERLGLPGIGVETARVMTDKGAMRTRLAEHSVPQPPFAITSSANGALAALEAVGLPAVLKPTDCGGQRGVYRIEKPSDLSQRLPQTLAQSRSGKAILERYVAGSELNAIVVVRGGEPTLLTLSDRLRPPGRGFAVGWIHLFPSELDASSLDKAGRVAVDAVRALGLTDGIAFPQLLVTGAGDVDVVEVAARVPAGQMADLVRLGIGVDLVDIALRQALGERIPDGLVERRFVRPLAIRFFTAKPGVLPTGRVVSVSGLDRVLEAPGVLEAGVYIRPGETIRPVQVDADRRGYVIATGPDARAALELAETASRELRVEIEA